MIGTGIQPLLEAQPYKELVRKQDIGNTDPYAVLIMFTILVSDLLMFTGIIMEVASKIEQNKIKLERPKTLDLQ